MNKIITHKLLIFILIILLAILIAGTYGIIHDQITFSISEEYYTKFKFIQFGLDNWGLGDNIGTLEEPEMRIYDTPFAVGIVGFMATWWMGLFFGIVLGLVNFFQKSARNMFFTSIKAVFLIVIVTIVFGFLGYVYANLFLVNTAPNWHFPNNLIDKTNYIRVGSMHNFAYLGGVLGLLLAIRFSLRNRNL